MEWIDLARDRGRWRAVINVVMIFGLYKMQGFLTSCGNVSFSGRTLLHGVS
jgi:hypothetical protein